MKFLSFLLLLISSSFSLDTVTIKHKSFITIFDTVKHYPVIVSWWCSKKSISCNNRIERTNDFSPDPDLKRHTDLSEDYKNSGYDRGHNSPAFDNSCDSISQIQCFYYSNMVPQLPSLNRGDWKELEEYTRNIILKYDSVKIWCGSTGWVKKIKRLTVPQYCWKIIYIKKLKTYEAYIFNNSIKLDTNVQFHRTTTTSIFKLTGLKIY